MTADAAGLLESVQNWLPSALLTFLRVGAAMAVLPAFGESTVPQRVRIVVALAFTAAVLPMVTPARIAGLAPAALIRLGFLEVVAGLMIGISLRLFIHALQTAGAIAAQTVSLSQLLGTAAAEPQPAIGQVLVVAGLALAVTLGLHVQFVKYILLSYDILPAGRGIPGQDLVAWGVPLVARAFRLAFSISAPFAIASLIYNFALGAINRAMPQLMVSFVGAPAITFGGLLMLFLAAPLMLAAWGMSWQAFLADPFGTPP